MKTIITLVFVAFSYVGFAQLIDPFGKVVTHEIKLNKEKDGTYIGAIEWTSGGLDSLQRFVIKDLDIKAPVMVTILSKAPDHNIDVGFYKQNWELQESKISTHKEKFANKLFRTMGTTGLGVSSKVAGIPYLITVNVGLQFPSTQPLIRFTDDKEEYTQHMRKMGYMGQLFANDNFASSSNDNSITSNSGSKRDNSLMYIIIALLAVIAILFAIFIIKSKSSKTTMLLLCYLGFSQLVISQGSVPHNVPITDMRQVFVGYQTQNVPNQVPITYGEPGLRPAMDSEHREHNGNGILRIQPNQSGNELSGDEVLEIQRRMNEDREAFHRDFGPNSPGDETEGDQRTLPTDRDEDELNEIIRKIEELQRQVDLLSQEDRESEGSSNQGIVILQYCEQIPDCKACIKAKYRLYLQHYSYYQFLQKFYLKKATELNDWIAYGNSMANLPGGGGIGWNGKLIRDVRPAMDKLKLEYDNKFDYYIKQMERDLRQIKSCYTGDNDAYPSLGAYEAQVGQVIFILKAARIAK